MRIFKPLPHIALAVVMLLSAATAWAGTRPGLTPGLTFYENCAAFHYIMQEKTDDEATKQNSAALSDLFIKIAAMERERIGDSAENTMPQISKQIDAFCRSMGTNYDETGYLWGKDPFFVELMQNCADFVRELESEGAGP
jgi:hypothetical protein